MTDLIQQLRRVNHEVDSKLKELDQNIRINNNEQQTIELQNRQTVELVREAKALEKRKQELVARQEQLQIDNKFTSEFIDKGLV